MRKRLVRALVFVVVALGASVGIGSAAGAIELDSGPGHSFTTFGIVWD